MLLGEVVRVSTEVAKVRGRLKKAELIAGCLAAMTPEELEIAVPFLSGEVRQGKIGFGYASVMKAGGGAAGTSSLALAEVDAVLGELSTTSGAGSQKRRTDLLSQLFSRTTADEADFLKRLLVGELRQGALEALVLEGLAKATGVSLAVIRKATMLSGSAGVVARIAATEGEAALGVFRIELFRPVQPMLAQTAESVEAAFTAGKAMAVEFKLDGARIQVHRRGENVKIYTRNANDVTARIPEIVELVRGFPADEFILDGEAIALRADGRPLPFQVTMSRFGRRTEDETLQREVPLRAFFFDCLQAAGNDVIGKRASERIELLGAIVGESSGVPRLVTEDAALAAAFLLQAQNAGHEGVMVKELDATYEAGRRGASWLKVKSAHTLDLVVLAVEWGSGRRKGLLSNLHLSARDPAGGFVMLGKTFKGMTDQMLAFQTERLLSLETSRDAYTVNVRPELVVEIAFDGVQKSTQYPGGMALRFARVKGYREDKTPADADTIGTVREIYERSLGSGAEDFHEQRDE